MARFSAELQSFFFPVASESAASTGEYDGADPSSPQSEPLVGDRITLADILTLAGDRTFGFLLVLLALPSALPVPAPGYSTPFGIVIVILAAQLIIGRHRPWLPQKLQEGALERSKAAGLIKAGLPWLRRLEMVSKPRFSFVCNSMVGRMAIGLVILIMGLCMMIPVPGTNTIPAMVVFILGFSLIEEDGLISIVGLTACATGCIFVYWALVEGLPRLLN